MYNLILILVFLTIGFLYTACKGQEGPTESRQETKIEEEKADGMVSEIEEKTEKMHEEHAEEEGIKAPLGIAADLWKLIQRENYTERWKMWPGKEALYEGTPPHGASLTTYVNSAGYDAVVKKEDELPPGAIIVTENYMPDNTLEAISVMYNLADFDPLHGNWFWAKYDAGGNPMTMESDGKTITLAGKLTSCIACHRASTSGIQFIMTAPE